MSFTERFKGILAAIAENRQELLQELTYEVPEAFNWVRDVMEAIHLPQYADKDLLELICESGKEYHLSYGDALRQCNQLLNYLQSHGLRKGDRVFVMCGLHPELWTIYLALIKGGFVMIPVAGILNEDDILYRFRTAAPAAIITDLDNLGKIVKALERHHKEIPVRLIIDSAAESWTNLDVIKTQAVTAIAADTLATDPLFWFFTSGTTGMPKVAAHTQSSYPLGHLSTSAWIGIRPEDKHYNISQPGWAKFAWSCFFAPLNMGATVFCYRQLDRFNAHAHLEAIEKYKVTTLCAPPTALRLLIQKPLADYKFSLRECVSAGEPLNPEVIEAWKTGTGLLIRDGYGQTESTCMVNNPPGSKVRYGSMGRPSFLYDIVIADEDGAEAPLLEEGQIAVRMHPGRFNGVFKEYIGDPEKTTAVFKHGLYYTGDKAYKDADGYIWFVGRSDDVIKSSDYRVGPFEVESILLEVDEVQESAVVGSPHPIKGYEIKAFVVLKPDIAPTHELAEKIFTYSRHHLAPYKIPRILEFVAELPKTISGKIKRMELRALEAERRAKGEKGLHEFLLHKH